MGLTPYNNRNGNFPDPFKIRRPSSLFSYQETSTQISKFRINCNIFLGKILKKHIKINND